MTTTKIALKFLVGLIIILLLTIFGLLAYNFFFGKEPTQNQTETTTQTKPQPDTQTQPATTNWDRFWKTTLITIGIIGGIFLIYYIFLHKRSPGVEIPQDVPVDEAKSVITKHLCDKYGIPYNTTNNTPLNPDDIRFLSQRIHTTPPGMNFAVFEVEIPENDINVGIHTLHVPLSKGKKTIEQGNYSFFENTNIFTFDALFMPNKYPIASFSDKEQQRLQMLANIDPAILSSMKPEIAQAMFTTKTPTPQTIPSEIGEQEITPPSKTFKTRKTARRY